MAFMNSMNRIMMECACKVAAQIKAKAILLYADMTPEVPTCQAEKPGYEIILVTKDDGNLPEKIKNSVTVLNVPNVQLTRVGQIKLAITKGISAGLFRKGDRLVCLSGVPKFGYVDSMFVIDVGKEFEILTLENITDITDGVYPEVLDAVLNIALELAAQGREGRKVGTIFILGDHEKVLQLSRQMVINPFMGYREEDRNILNPDLLETIKEFSAIDGAFVIKDNGVVITAGRYLSASLESKEFPQGLGSRHIASAGITSITHAVAIVLSESTGNVTVFKNGKIFVQIEKPVE
jgi:diadenylate cyclase